MAQAIPIVAGFIAAKVVSNIAVSMGVDEDIAMIAGMVAGGYASGSFGSASQVSDSVSAGVAMDSVSNITSVPIDATGSSVNEMLGMDAATVTGTQAVDTGQAFQDMFTSSQASATPLTQSVMVNSGGTDNLTNTGTGGFDNLTDQIVNNTGSTTTSVSDGSVFNLDKLSDSISNLWDSGSSLLDKTLKGVKMPSTESLVQGAGSYLGKKAEAKAAENIAEKERDFKRENRFSAPDEPTALLDPTDRISDFQFNPAKDIFNSRYTK